MSFARNLPNKYGKQYCCKNRTRRFKNYFKKIVPKAAKATGESKGDKIANKIVKLKPVIGKY